MTAPAPVMGEPVEEYRRRLAVLAKKQLPADHDLKKIQIRALADDAFAVVESQLLPAVNQAAFRPDTVPADPAVARSREHRHQRTKNPHVCWPKVFYLGLQKPNSIRTYS
jgi:hypothetical protein